MFFQKPNSLFLCRFWTFELLYPPIVLPSLKNPPIEIEPGAAPQINLRQSRFPADTYIEIQPALSPNPS